MSPSTDKPQIQFIEDPFELVVICRKAAFAANWSMEKYVEFLNEATSQDHDHFIQTVKTYFQTE